MNASVWGEVNTSENARKYLKKVGYHSLERNVIKGEGGVKIWESIEWRQPKYQKGPRRNLEGGKKK